MTERDPMKQKSMPMTSPVGNAAPDPRARRLPAARLRASVDPALFPFASTEELVGERAIVGQDRAVKAVDFGLHIQGHGYNIYAAGAPGTGKATVIKSMVERVASAQPAPEDWCYVYNFQDADRPRALNLPAGRGREFERDLERLVAQLREAFPRAFQSKDYEDEHRLIEEAFDKTHAKLSHELEQRAQECDFLIRPTRVGIMIVPLYKGKALEAEEFEALEPTVKAEIRRKEEEIEEAVRAFRQQIRVAREEADRRVAQLNERVARYTSEHLFESLCEKYAALPKVGDYLAAVQRDVQEHFEDFLSPDGGGTRETPGLALRYAVNVVVDNQDTHGAPIIEESNPTHANLIGRMEKKARMGFLYTDFTLIKAGSLLRANGGYLLLNVIDVLRNPFSWDALKRVIKHEELIIEDPSEAYGIISSSGLKPEPIPIRVRVVLIGNPMLYYLLHAYDEDFRSLFKVKADFDVEQDRSDQAPKEYGRFIANLCQDEHLPHFDRGAVGAFMEQAARAVEHQHKLSVRFGELADLVREAGYWAGRDGKPVVSAVHVQRAVEEKIYRSNLLEQRIRALITEGTLAVDVRGAAVGQVNALSVYDLGDMEFGRPSRITARIFLAQPGIINIEREAKMSGRVHSKGVLILAGYLAGRYARNTPLSLAATLAFEQSYGQVEGDSASVPELAALLSALCDVPLRQDIAVTGSLNQHGKMQAVGGINAKIEGYFAVCQVLGLTGEQGVIIPEASIKHLMLKDEVVQAAAADRFHIYAVPTVDEVMEILTGQAAGQRQPDGTFPPGTLNAAVLKRLQQMEERLFEMPKRMYRERLPAAPD
jgi:predicted ATP-dependent protease